MLRTRTEVVTLVATKWIRYLRPIIVSFSLMPAVAVCMMSRPDASAQTGATYTGDMNQPRTGHTATLLRNGKVLVAGGLYNGTFVTAAELYDPATGAWSLTGNMTFGRTRHTATLLPDGRVLVAGGITPTPIEGAELYDPATGTWSLAANMIKSRAWHSATLLRNGRVLVVGGYGPDRMESAETYDPNSDRWSLVGSLSKGRYAHTATLLADGRVLVAGGTDFIFMPFTVDEEYGAGLANSELFDPASGNWTTTSNLNEARYLHTATLLLNGKVLVTGGGSSILGLLDSMPDTAELYDPVTGAWSYTANLLGRAYHTATLLPNGQVLIAGGAIYGGVLAKTTIYDPQTGTWIATAKLNTPRSGHTATLLNNGRVLLAGGGTEPRTVRSAEIFESGAVTANLIDDPQFFVQQQYRDFLNREPDSGGFNFWSGQILVCGSDPQCIEEQRINDSAAFFLSIEFQETGYLVYRFYKAAFGDLSNAPVPIKLAEFLPDTQEIGKNVIVKQAGWEQVLENNKQAFATAFVQRQRFVSAYPTLLSADAFVDALFANAGVTPSSNERTSAIAEFGSAMDTTDVAARARALRQVAENPTFSKQEFNRAFVLMQYFGYLRRNPNDAPEPTLDFQGYDFWLNKLDSFNGDFARAEMVKAFIISAEYRQRFGP